MVANVLCKYTGGKKVQSYQKFAYVYDELMKEVEYDKWVLYIESLFQKYQIQPKTICDLGCGTGNISLPLAQKGYSVIGVDLSEAMLEVAQKKEANIDVNVQWLQQDMLDLKLPFQQDVILSLCDSLNYILEEEDLLEVFNRVYQALREDGLFIFDLNTLYKFEEVLKDHVFVEHSTDVTYVWENHYNEEKRINEYDVTFFIREKDGRYEKVQEFHEQRGYEIDQIKRLLNYADLELVDIFEATTFLYPHEESERIYFIAKKNKEIL